MNARRVRPASIAVCLFAVALLLPLATTLAQGDGEGLSASRPNPTVNAATPLISDGGIVEVLSGTVTISQDGTLLEVNGEIKIHPGSADIGWAPTVEAQEIPDVEQKEVPVMEFLNAPVETKMLQSTQSCYTHYAWQNIGSTRYERKTDYCVNDSGNEVVTYIKITNIGSYNTPRLIDEEVWGNQCPYAQIKRWGDGGMTYILYPGAAVQWSIWVEVFTGWGRTFRVDDKWENAWYYNCIGH